MDESGTKPRSTIAPIENNYDLIPVNDPDKVITEGIRIAGKLKALIIDNKKDYLEVNGKRHIYFSEWQTLGNWYNVDVETHIEEAVNYFGNKGIKASAIATNIKTGEIVGKGDGLCFRSEKGRQSHDWNQIASMAQTRAGSKALKNALGWVIELAGLSSTPAEDMMGIKEEIKEKQEKTKSGKKPRSSRTESSKNEESVPNGIDPETVKDAEIEEKNTVGDIPVEDVKNRDNNNPIITEEQLFNLKKLSKKLDETIDDDAYTRKDILALCQDLLGEKELTPDDFRMVKKILGMNGVK